MTPVSDVGVVSAFSRPSGKELWSWVARGDVAMALGVVGIIVLLILPIPAFVLDLLLAISITSAVLILMTSLMIKRPLEFTAFPTVLLVTTLYRLGLGLASTRLILGHGHEGTGGAGHIIQAFGQLMMQGNFVIGVIVFAILVIVNFVVITKGSSRIAEVAARFTLDSMPGKQMAIDADLSSGLCNEDEARRRRKELEQESTFFGAMDGASKFVRGDAVAGLIITGINIVGGLIIGVVQHHLPIGEAASNYTVMTIGDGTFMYNPVVPAVAFADEHRLPLLILVINNAKYAAMQHFHDKFYPDGTSITTKGYYGVNIVAPKYEQAASMVDGFAAKVEKPSELKGVLQKALASVQAGKTAIVNVVMPDAGNLR